MSGTLRPSGGRGAALLFFLYASRIGAVLIAILLVIGTAQWGISLLGKDEARPVSPPKQETKNNGESAEANPEIHSEAQSDAAPQRPESDVERGVKPVKKAVGAAAMGAAQALDTGERRWTEVNTADDANFWIWKHIKNGSYEKSRYSSAKGYTSFQKCLSDANLNIIQGTGVYSYDLLNNTSAFQASSFPTVTEEHTGDGRTLLVAIIQSDPKTNPYRLSMLSDLIEAGADVDQRFGPDGNTALMVAARQGDYELVQYLVKDAHADRKVENIKGSSASDMTQSESIGRLLR